MTTAALFTDLCARGVHLELAGEQLRCRADAGVLTLALAATIKAHKSALLAHLREEEAAITWRVEAMQQQIPTAAGPVPFLMAVSNVVPAAGVCLSCGDPLKMLGYVQRCRLCAVAAARALVTLAEDIAQLAPSVAAA